MQTTVSLQEPFSYSVYPILVCTLLMIGLAIYLLWKRKKKPEENEIPVIKEIEKDDLAGIQIRYLRELDFLKRRVEKGQMSVRRAYQELSKIIRYFVYEVTDIRVQNYTLEEIQKVGLPSLTELISEYYEPEFAEHSLGDAAASIEKTRKVIKEWN